jgi:hypothetical protein
MPVSFHFQAANKSAVDRRQVGGLDRKKQAFLVRSVSALRQFNPHP